MKNEYKNQVFIYGLPAGGDSLTSQSLARRKCLLMGPSLSLYRSVPGYYCIFSLNLAKLFFLLLLSSSSFFFIFNYFFSSSNWLFHLRPFSFLLAVRFPAKHCWHVSTTDRAILGWRAGFFFFFQIVFWPSPHNFLGPFLFRKREKYFLFSPINSVYSFVRFKILFSVFIFFFEWGKRSIQAASQGAECARAGVALSSSRMND